MMAIRKYKKPHLCKHVLEVFNMFVVVSDECIYWRSPESFGIDKDFVFKATCRECKHFELKESNGKYMKIWHKECKGQGIIDSEVSKVGFIVCKDCRGEGYIETMCTTIKCAKRDCVYNIQGLCNLKEVELKNYNDIIGIPKLSCENYKITKYINSESTK